MTKRVRSRFPTVMATRCHGSCCSGGGLGARRSKRTGPDAQAPTPSGDRASPGHPARALDRPGSRRRRRGRRHHRLPSLRPCRSRRTQTGSYPPRRNETPTTTDAPQTHSETDIRDTSTWAKRSPTPDSRDVSFVVYFETDFHTTPRPGLARRRGGLRRPRQDLIDNRPN